MLAVQCIWRMMHGDNLDTNLDKRSRRYDFVCVYVARVLRPWNG